MMPTDLSTNTSRTWTRLSLPVAAICVALSGLAEGRLIVAAPTSAFSREGDLRHVGKEKTMRANVRDSSRELTMPFTRTVTMLALAREALERFDNNADAAQAYLSERLVNDEQLREALV